MGNCFTRYFIAKIKRVYMGLLMLVKGRSVIRVNMGAITLQTRYGAEQSFQYKNILDRPENGVIYNA
jgi:hypothetical protein